MKPVILSFFAVILVYSLFVDKEEEQKEKQPIHLDIQSIHYNSVDTALKTDTMIFFANKAYLFQ